MTCDYRQHRVDKQIKMVTQPGEAITANDIVKGTFVKKKNHFKWLLFQLTINAPLM